MRPSGNVPRVSGQQPLKSPGRPHLGSAPRLACSCTGLSRAMHPQWSQLAFSREWRTSHTTPRRWQQSRTSLGTPTTAPSRPRPALAAAVASSSAPRRFQSASNAARRVRSLTFYFFSFLLASLGDVLTCRVGVGCVYDNKRNKSGMKAGAIEGLHRRIGNNPLF